MGVPLAGLFLVPSTTGATMTGLPDSGVAALLDDLELYILFFLDHRSLGSLSSTCRALHNKDLPSCIMGLHLYKLAQKSNLSWLTQRVSVHAPKAQLRFLRSLHVTFDGHELKSSGISLGYALQTNLMPQLEVLDLCFNRYKRPRLGGVDPTVAVKEWTPGVAELLDGVGHVLERGRLTSLILYKLDLREGGRLENYDLRHLRVLDVQFCHMAYGYFLPRLLARDNSRSLNPAILQALRLPFVFELSPVTDNNIDTLVGRLRCLGQQHGLPGLQLLDFTATRSGQWFSLRSPWEGLKTIFPPGVVVESFRDDHCQRVYRGLDF